MTTESASVAGGMAAGAIAIFLAEAGLTAADLGYAALGTGLGTVSTRGLPRLQALFLFVGLTVVAALMARWCAANYFSADPLASRGLSAAFGFIAYAIRAQILNSIPEIWGAALRRFGVRPVKQEDKT